MGSIALQRRQLLSNLAALPRIRKPPLTVTNPICINKMVSTATAVRPKTGKQSFSSQLTQMYPGKPTFTEANVPDLGGKVVIVTGASSGVGKEAARIMYSKNARVYVAARSEARASQAIADIQAAHPASKGSLVFLLLDLSDFASVKFAAAKFFAAESRLDVLINNAATQALKDADGSKTRTAQGHEVHLGVNVLAPFLFTKLLTPLLTATAQQASPGSVRVVWVSSMGTETIGELSRGISADYVNYWPLMSPLERYGLSKAGNWLHGVEMARQLRDAGVMSVPINPGHLDSELYREGGTIFKAALKTLALFPSVYGAYVELYAAFSRDLNMEHSGAWVVPWGRLYPIRKDLLDATKSKAEGGNGHAQEFWDWCEGQVKDFV